MKAEYEAALTAKDVKIDESDALIAELETKNRDLLENAAAAEEKTKTLEKQLEEERYKNIELGKLHEMQ